MIKQLYGAEKAMGVSKNNSTAGRLYGCYMDCSHTSSNFINSYVKMAKAILTPAVHGIDLMYFYVKVMLDSEEKLDYVNDYFKGHLPLIVIK